MDSSDDDRVELDDWENESDEMNEDDEDDSTGEWEKEDLEMTENEEYDSQDDWENESADMTEQDEDGTHGDLEKESVEINEKEADGGQDDDCSSGNDILKSKLEYSPGGKTKLWRPVVAKEFIPVEKATYESIDAAVKMYELYAEKAGFNTRLNTTKKFADNTYRVRWVVCNRNGKIPDKSVDTLDIEGTGRKNRNSNFRITDCKALIKFERESMYSPVCKIREFKELHNHELDTKEEQRYARSCRKLNFSEKEFLVRLSTVNIGATVAHKLRASLKGGYRNVGPEVIDYKNYRRKIGNIIGDRDAQMVVDKMMLRKDELTNYTFEYKCVDSVLNAMFWADETQKMYYKEFGDVISFDATFRTNKYDMVFVPFTAVDNHNRSIIVGAGLLSNETIESYQWLLESFMKAHEKQPILVLTDQDPAVIQAVAKVFPDSNHRLCMWHIMKKLQAKVSQDLLKNTDFRKRLSKLVWNVYLEPKEFEEGWKLLMREFKLEDKRWFIDMYDIRMSWIPAYFKEIPMHGLMKTTSRSESINSFFNKYNQSGNLLVYFMLNYDTAVEKQRNNQRKLENETKIANHELNMPTGLEKHAARVYTKTMFLDVQKEIYRGAWNCSVDSVEMVNGWKVVMITHVGTKNQVKTNFRVELKLPDKEINCSCQRFTRVGLLCRHIFAVLKNEHIEEIPEKYILRRWRRDVIASHHLLVKYGFDQIEDDSFKLITEAFSNLEFCLDRVKGDKEKLVSIVEKTRNMKNEVETVSPKQPVADDNEEEAIKILGVTIPESVEILVPKGIRNKGRGKKRRMVSAAEKGSTNSKKKTRKCSGCNKYINHNWRTCRVRIEREKGVKNK